MRIIINECKKILDIRIILLLGMFSVLYYMTFTQIYRYPTGGQLTNTKYDIPFTAELVKEWGPKWKVKDEKQYQEKHQELERGFAKIIKQDQELSKRGIVDYEIFNKKYEEPKPDNNGTDNVYPDNNYTFINNIHQTITNNKYVTHKTMVLDSKSDSNSITVSYMVYDPLTEFTSVYIVVKLGESEVGRYTVDPASTTYDIKGLLPGQEYTLEFYYDFKDNGNVVSQKFDEIKVKTKSVNGQITLDKVSANSVSYILKVDGSIDYAKANLYIDDILVATDNNLNLELAKNGGYTGLFSYSGVGKIAKIVIEDATLNGANMGIIATYKYIL